MKRRTFRLLYPSEARHCTRLAKRERKKMAVIAALGEVPGQRASRTIFRQSFRRSEEFRISTGSVKTIRPPLVLPPTHRPAGCLVSLQRWRSSGDKALHTIVVYQAISHRNLRVSQNIYSLRQVSILSHVDISFQSLQSPHLSQ